VVAFCAAGLAFGRVASVLQSVERLLAVVGDRPAEYVRRFDPRREAAAYQGLVHRWIQGPDLLALMWILKQMFDRSGSIEGFFSRGSIRPPPTSGRRWTISHAGRVRSILRRAYGRVPQRPGVCYFFPRSSSGSGCKRLNLFLRWMVRHDALDSGCGPASGRRAGRAARHARDPARAVSAADRLHQPRLADGSGDHRVVAAARIRSIP